MARRTKKAGGASEGMQIAKLFKNGRSQAVRLPKEFRFEGDAVYVKPVAGGVVLLADQAAQAASPETLRRVTLNSLIWTSA